jgi:hypothetical protein
MVEVDMSIYVKPEDYEMLKKVIDRVYRGMNNVIRSVVEDPKFLDYLKENAKVFRYDSQKKQIPTKFVLDKQVYEKLRQIIESIHIEGVKLSLALVFGLIISYYLERIK